MGTRKGKDEAENLAENFKVLISTKFWLCHFFFICDGRVIDIYVSKSSGFFLTTHLSLTQIQHETLHEFIKSSEGDTQIKYICIICC